ncbi:GNAT family N-acetyltransferase [Halapricum sp. CBA1109]|uniref:GNAT family N-acetyltransferase n=1 Tax=Halapricum sp. CBA1109 TaxID=2668068 RepID=UPI0012F965A9|nr:GNAT family N-acetyltransferase [Halapricum sp. CBA1109]MUV90991.1 GNAT family N-acetyltransferase [Halapricum sp. CBA1109]
MEITDDLDFEHRDRQDIYEYVEQMGEVDLEEARQALHMDERAIGHHVAILKRDGILKEVDGQLQIAYDEDTEAEFSGEDVSFTIRQARQADLTGLVGAIREVVENKTYVDAETVADVVDNEGVLLRHNEIESRMFFVACVDDDVVGWVHIKHPEVAKLAHTAELTLGVLEAYRGNGMGSHLLSRGVEWAGNQGYEKLYNSVPATNEGAIEFLQSHDWSIEATREDHYRIDDEYVDEVMLAREL